MSINSKPAADPRRRGDPARCRARRPFRCRRAHAHLRCRARALEVISFLFPPAIRNGRSTQQIFLEEAAPNRIARRTPDQCRCHVDRRSAKIAPHVTAMKANIAAALGVSPNDIGIKATTSETMGFVGRRRYGRAAVASVELPN